MGTIRFFSGSRNTTKTSGTAKFFAETQGKLTRSEQWKYIRDKKMAEAKKTLGTSKIKMSKKAEEALQQIAKKKANKEAKALSKRVLVEPRNFANGRIVKDGKIYDIAGNVVARVDRNNGKIVLGGMSGMGIGKYNPKSFFTNTLIQGTIDKYSPYYINLRKMQAMQQGTSVWGPNSGGASDVISVHGRSVRTTEANLYGPPPEAPGTFATYGSDTAAPRQNVGATAWGAMSDNVFGTFTDNAWGTSTDNVWGGNSSDVWGGIGGSPWGNFAKTVQVWGSGNGKNYLKGLTSRIATFFGLNSKTRSQRAAIHEAVRGMRSTRSTGSSASTARSAAPVTRAPTTPTRR